MELGGRFHGINPFGAKSERSWCVCRDDCALLLARLACLAGSKAHMMVATFPSCFVDKVAGEINDSSKSKLALGQAHAVHAKGKRR
jgi:hypothetical protein